MSLDTVYIVENWKLKIILKNNNKVTVHQRVTVDMPICTVHDRRWFKIKKGPETHFDAKCGCNNWYPNGTLISHFNHNKTYYTIAKKSFPKPQNFSQHQSLILKLIKWRRAKPRIEKGKIFWKFYLVILIYSSIFQYKNK